MTKEERFEENQRLVHFVVGKYFPNVKSKEDAIQDGMMGLWKACLMFSEDKGIRFSTFACKCITNEILFALRRERKHYEIASLDEQLQIADKSCEETTCNEFKTKNLNAEESEFMEKILRGDTDFLKVYGGSKLRSLKKSLRRKLDRESLI